MFYIALPVKDGSEINGYIRLARPLFEIRNAAREFCGLILQLFGIILVFSFVIAFIFFSRLISPIEEMEQFTKRLLRKGDDPETLIINSSDEMGRLAGNINYIIMELQYRVRYADEEKGKVEAAFAGMSDGVMVLNSQDKIETLNKTFEDISGIRGIVILSVRCRSKKQKYPFRRRSLLEMKTGLLWMLISPRSRAFRGGR
jgi:signal transduction histidine kinase